MGELAKHTILQLQQGVCGEELSECCLIASDLIIKAVQPSYISGFADIDVETVTREEREQLLDALTSLLPRTQSTEETRQIIFTLGKSGDPRYQAIYISLLQKAIDDLKTQNALIYHLLIALDNANIDVFERDADGSTSQSDSNITKNLRQAEQFLRHPPRKKIIDE